MEREIKFRAWQNGQMCEIDGNSKVTLCFNKIAGWNIAREPQSQYLYWLMGESSKEPGDFILMQFTGLKDKNGVEIYEGDYLSDKWKCEVYKDKNTGAYMVKFHNNPDKNKPRTLYDYLKEREKAGTAERDCVVIGNIYQNT